MRRSLLVTTVLLVGCTRLNPAFDSDTEVGEEGSETSTDSEDEVADATEVGESESEAESESGEPDLPPSVCEFQPSDGLKLVFGDPIHFGGNCPNGVETWARVIELSGDKAVVETCGAGGCIQCGGPQPLSISPLLLANHLSGNDPAACLQLEASVPLGPSPDGCRWGAISLFDGNGDTPFVIATSMGSEPTPRGLQTLAGLIAEPVSVGSCSCEDVGQDHDCCNQAPNPPEFFGYPFGDKVLLPGQNAVITIPNQAGGDHYFEVFQAERLNTCEGPERALSWAVVAKLP